jgi:hypothetical protein
MYYDSAKLIKESVPVSDAVKAYVTGNISRSRIPCPIHHGEHNNFWFCETSYKCFSCGASGDVISLVQSLFELSFIEALSKLNDDFNCGLILDRAPTYRERAKIQHKRAELIEREKTRQEHKNAVQAECWRLMDMWIALDTIRMHTRPKSPNEPCDPNFAYAVSHLPIIECELNAIPIEKW